MTWRPRVGLRVQTIWPVTSPVRVGTIVRLWSPWAQVRVQWDNGTTTNINTNWLAPLEGLAREGA